MKNELHQTICVPLRVRYGECDPGGIVFNANFLLYADVAFTEFWRTAVGPWDGLLNQGVDVVVGEAKLRFLAPVRFDDEIELRVTPLRLGETSLETEHLVIRAGREVARIDLRHVCIDVEDRKKTRWPAAIRAALSANGAL